MDCKNLKILICDDSIISRKKIKDILAKLSCSNLYEAKDGQEAIDMYIKSCPNVVFMDITMPVKTGIEALQEIIKINKKAKVIITSSSITQSHIKAAIDAGAYDFMQKPFVEEQINKIIKRVSEGGE
ncbi:response regulator [Sedimentibacter sp. zth1]|uniref:response regulator n=1 Tax=Sedimentibacter sp. zth1 TaxID=2816908 RepID=UPI001A918FA0|nr:response regulator [Sedimentibacter sp. zth1]QSX05746.1 response regulator [Sedimentibacter sp. zth1]